MVQISHREMGPISLGEIVVRVFLARQWGEVFMDSNRPGLWGVVMTSWSWSVVAAFHRVGFSSHKAALAAKNEANYH